MSQEKVDRYKEAKRTREKIMKRQKREWLLTKIGLGVFGAVILGWAGFSDYETIKGPAEVTAEAGSTYTVDFSAIDGYMDGLSVD